MADITFNQFIEEQKKTTSSVNSLGETLREQLLLDKITTDTGEEQKSILGKIANSLSFSPVKDEEKQN